MAAAGLLDVITIGRSSVDLYGQQIGGRLEDMDSFAKSVGGCPANIAIGTARLGLKSALITRVGDEHMGRFIREQLEREGVDTDGIVTDRERLTALVLLGVRDQTSFPLIFYRENCADMALCEDDVAPEFIARAKAIVVTGTHFSAPGVDAASRRAIRIAREAGVKVVFDIDYRPNLWRLAGHGAGEDRFVASPEVTKRLQSILPDCDLIVGTEEELFIASGTQDIMAALRRIRALSPALILCKRGPMGCVAFAGAIPETLDQGLCGPGFPVEVYNVLGAGDAFLSGFLRGWLRDETPETCATWATACGAFAVSRLLCSPESPTWEELSFFLEHGSPHRALRKDARINHLHWVTTRRAAPEHLMVLAMDHRTQFEAMAEAAAVGPDRIGPFKELAVKAAARVAAGRPGFGLLLDDTYGMQALNEAAYHHLWVARPAELPGSRHLDFEGQGDLGSRLVEWPVTHTVKCLCLTHPDDPEVLKQAQERELIRLHDACRRLRRELLIEIIAGKHGRLDDMTLAAVLRRLYDCGIKPDWWKLEPQTSPPAWRNITEAIEENDPHCRGILLLGGGASQAELKKAFHAAASSGKVKGFAVGRSIFAETAEAWFRGKIGDEDAVATMAGRFSGLVDAWQEAAGLPQAASAMSGTLGR